MIKYVRYIIVKKNNFLIDFNQLKGQNYGKTNVSHLASSGSSFDKEKSQSLLISQCFLLISNLYTYPLTLEI